MKTYFNLKNTDNTKQFDSKAIQIINIPNEEFLNSPPSIFLQTPSRKSRSGSIFGELEEEDSDSIDDNSKRTKTLTTKTLKSSNKSKKSFNELDDDENSDVRKFFIYFLHFFKILLYFY